MKYFKSILKVLKPQSISNLKIIVSAFRTYSFVSFKHKILLQERFKIHYYYFQIENERQSLGKNENIISVSVNAWGISISGC